MFLFAPICIKNHFDGVSLLDVVFQKCAIVQLFVAKTQQLLFRWDALLALDIVPYIVNGVRCLNFNCEGVSAVKLLLHIQREAIFLHLKLNQTQNHVLCLLHHF